MEVLTQDQVQLFLQGCPPAAQAKTSFEFQIFFKMQILCDLVGHGGEDEADANHSEPKYPWEGTDRDYLYEEVCVSV